MKILKIVANNFKLYYSGKNVKKLITNIRDYKKYKRHKDKSVLYLAIY